MTQPRRGGLPADLRESPLSDADLPALYQAADKSSLGAQRLFTSTTAGVLALVVGAAVCGALPEDVFGGTSAWVPIAGAIFFFVSVVLQGVLASRRPERAWYDGRALAESAKSLGWQFAVGGGRYPITASADDPAAGLRADLEALMKDLGEARPAEVPPGQSQVTPAMRELRRRSLPERRSAYRQGRIEDQMHWYAGKAAWNRKRANYWFSVAVGFQLAGGAFAVLRAADVIHVDLLGIAAAVTASVVGWLAVKDHRSLSEAYSLASHELSLVEVAMEAATDETTWSQFVADAEQAVSREHRMWRASRSARASS